MRYQTIERELSQRRESLSDVSLGLSRFLVGLGKKMLLANTLGQAAADIFAMDPAGMPAALAWTGAILYTFQIFFDFSGYSDMAIGLGRIFGFHFLENFNYPYISRSITEFWRRWHMSLSSWFRDYVYIPLGLSLIHISLLSEQAIKLAIYNYAKEHGLEFEALKDFDPEAEFDHDHEGEE